MGKNIGTFIENVFERDYKTLNRLLNLVEKEYKSGNSFSKNGEKFSESEKFFMGKIEKLFENFLKTKDKRYIKISYDILNKYNKIIEKYS